ncbi:MAG TPA: FtsX-like permease family protein, partial [Dehalococcoidia bacterium]|nr:FtsX-like permease family protein [Dehalococcoidia bacterium]
QAATSGEFAEATRERILGELLPIISVVLALAFIVGLTIAGLTIYTATVERAREWGILKAVGFRNVALYRAVLAQSVATAASGFAAGALLAFLFAPYADDLAPQLILTTKWYDVLAVGGLTLVMAVIASFVPVRRIGNVDPVTVFHA